MSEETPTEMKSELRRAVEAVLDGARARGEMLVMCGVNLSGADLRKADLRGAELTRNRREAKRQEAERFLAARNEEGKTNDAHK